MVEGREGRGGAARCQVPSLSITDCCLSVPTFHGGGEVVVTQTDARGKV